MNSKNIMSEHTNYMTARFVTLNIIVVLDMTWLVSRFIQVQLMAAIITVSLRRDIH